MLDFETKVKSFRMSWFKRSYLPGWECYFTYQLKPFGGLFLLPCDNDPKDYSLSNQFYAELIQFRGLSLGTTSLIRTINAQSHMSGCLKMLLKN